MLQLLLNTISLNMYSLIHISITLLTLKIKCYYLNKICFILFLVCVFY